MPVARGAYTDKDNNNCTVRALCNTTGIDIETATKEFALVGRKNGEGSLRFHEVYSKYGAKIVGVYGTTICAYDYFKWSHKNLLPSQRVALFESYRKKGCTLNRFIEENPVGKFIILIRGHATALVDGKIIDTGRMKGGSSVVMAYKVD